MAGTVLILIKFVAPSVLDGNDPVLVCVVAASAIAFFSLYLTHGANIMTTVALTGTLIALALTLAISSVFFELAKFSGFASEEAFILPYLAEGLDVRGLLLGGTIIAALGALECNHYSGCHSSRIGSIRRPFDQGTHGIGFKGRSSTLLQL